MITSTMPELTKVVQTNHEHSTDMFTDLRTEVSALSSNMCSAMGMFEEHMEHGQKDQQPECGIAVLATHDYIKYILATHMVEDSLGTRIFTHTVPGARANTLIPSSFENVFNVADRGDISPILSKKFYMGSNTIFFHTYMDRTSGRPHDTILLKLSNAFLEGLPSAHTLSATSIASASRRQECVLQVDEKREYYSSAQYSTAWTKSCQTALREVLSAAGTAVRNV